MTKYQIHLIQDSWSPFIRDPDAFIGGVPSRLREKITFWPKDYEETSHRLGYVASLVIGALPDLEEARMQFQAHIRFLQDMLDYDYKPIKDAIIDAVRNNYQEFTHDHEIAWDDFLNRLILIYRFDVSHIR